jgi:hypothetical protein
VVGEASGLALLAAFYPAGLLVVAIYLGTPRPRQTGLLFVFGALGASLVMAVAVYAILKSGHIDLPKERHTRYGLRLGLGVLMIAGCLFLARRRPKPKADKTSAQRKFGGLMGRLLTNPGPATAFVMGFVLFFFSLTFIAAIQVVATARAGTAATALAFALVVVLYAGCAWLPYLCYLIYPEGTTRRLRVFNSWLAAHGRALYLGGLGLAGVVVALDGVLGLAGLV